MPLLPLIALAATAMLPKNGADLIGRYVMFTGFAVTTVDLSKQGRVAFSTQPDHPGSWISAGIWKYRNDCVEILSPSDDPTRPGLDHSVFVPLVWGDRFMLVHVEHLMSGVYTKLVRLVRSKSLNGRFGYRATDLPGMVRMARPRMPLPKLYGDPKVPLVFKELLS